VEAAAPVTWTAPAAGSEGKVLLEGRRLGKAYAARGRRFTRGERIRALEDADFTLRAGERVAVVGPSGSGKSTLARCLAGLEPPTAGEVLFEQAPVTGLRGAARRLFQRAVQMVFQEAASSLNPRWPAGRSVAEPLTLLGLAPPAEAERRVGDQLKEVGLPPDAARRPPRELSGGQRQRVALARAIGVGPRALLLDEATTGLDGPVQAQILALVKDLQARNGLACVFVSHDLRLVAAVADRVVVMDDGRIVETGAVEEVLRAPSHETTRALVRAAFGSPS
jgi:peptide/nickel transport system ATP-binding protein